MKFKVLTIGELFLFKVYVLEKGTYNLHANKKWRVVKMARKTKVQLEQEVKELKWEIEDLKNEIITLNLDQDFWFLKSEQYRYKVDRRNDLGYFVDMENKEREITEFLEEKKREEMRQKLFDPYYRINYID